jgi:hypothetical protein
MQWRVLNAATAERRCRPTVDELQFLLSSCWFRILRGSSHMDPFRGTKTLRFLWTEQRGLCAVSNIKITRITGWRLHHCVPLVKGWFEERGKPRFTSSRVPRQGSPSAPFRIEAASPSKRRSQGLSRLSTRVSRPDLRGPGPSNGGWLLGSEYTNVRKRRQPKRA